MAAPPHNSPPSRSRAVNYGVAAWRRIGLAAMGLVAAGLFASLPALADSNCDSGEFCIWGGQSYTGDFWDPSTSDPDWPYLGSTGVQNDDDSVRNREGTRVLVWSANNYSGTVKYCVLSGQLASAIHANRDDAGNSSQTHGSLNSCNGYAAPGSP